MKTTIAKALTADSLYQVLDNWVFRILAVLVFLPILTVFVFGFREDGIVLLFGLKEWDYEPIFRFFGLQGQIEGAHELIIEGILQVTFSLLAGSFGVIFCIAATAFFVPRMIEKGAADVLFHKPVSRLSLWLSRYFAGLLFVALLSAVLVVGMYLGLLLVSGHNDLGILWAAPALVYLFGLIHAVSMLVGILTRSTVASILLAVLFFFGNGCVHQVWTVKEQSVAMQQGTREPDLGLDGEREDGDEGEPPAEPPPDAGAEGAEGAEGDEGDEGDEESGMSFGRLLVGTLDALHYALPKTGDADYMAAKLRRATSGPAYEDEDTGLRIVRVPTGMDEVRIADRPAPAAPMAEVLGTLVFAAAGDDASVELWSRPRRDLEDTLRSGRVRSRSERLDDTADALKDALEAEHPDVTIERLALPTRGSEGEAPDEPRVDFQNEVLRFTRPGAAGTDRVDHVLFKSGSTVYALRYAGSVERAADDLDELAKNTRFVFTPQDWYGEQIGWDAELKYNLFFSIATSAAFAAVVLFIGWLKLRRIEF